MRNKRVIRLTESEFNGLVTKMVSRAVNRAMINEVMEKHGFSGEHEGFTPINKNGEMFGTNFFISLAKESYKFANNFITNLSKATGHEFSSKGHFWGVRNGTEVQQEQLLAIITYVTKVLENENYNEIPKVVKQIDKAVKMLHSLYKEYGNSAKFHLAITEENLNHIKTFLQQQMNQQQQIGAQQGNM